MSERVIVISAVVVVVNIGLENPEMVVFLLVMFDFYLTLPCDLTPPYFSALKTLSPPVTIYLIPDIDLPIFACVAAQLSTIARRQI